MRILCPLFLTLCLPAIANAIDLNDSKGCASIGGQWIVAPTFGRIGSCTLSQVYTVPRNERLEIGVSVDLVLANGGALNIDGELLIIDTAAVLINGGSLQNNNYIDINNDGELTLNTGYIGNHGVISSEGNITNNHTIPMGQSTGGGIFNYNVISNFDGGEIHNYGRILSTHSASIITDLRGTFRNYQGGFYAVGLDEIRGRLENQAGGYIVVGHRLTINQGAIFESAGDVNVGYGLLLGEKGSRITLLTGSATTVATSQVVGTIMANGEFSNAGNLWLGGVLMSTSTIGNQLSGSNSPVANVAPGSISVHSTGKISIQDNVFTNNVGASIVNSGTIVLSCFSAWNNNGMFSGNAVLQGCTIPPVTLPPLPKLF